MENNTKETKLYILLQIILISLVIMVFLYMYILIKDANDDKYASYNNQESQVVRENTTSGNLQNNNETKNTEEVIPLVKDNPSNGTSYTTNGLNNKYFYNQLNDNAKLIYDEIEKNIENLKSGQYTIDLPSSVSDILKQDSGDEALNINFQSAWDAIGLDRVDLFFMDVSKVNMIVTKTTFVKSTSYKLAMKPRDSSGYLLDDIFNGSTVDSMVKEIENKRDEIVKTLVGSDYDKVLKAHDWLVDNVEYDTTLSDSYIYNLYGALVSRKAVCEGYAEAFKYLMDYAGVPCILVVGSATNSNGDTENHEWNYVKINKKWYAVDCTWDDPIITGNGKITNNIKYKYFLKGADTINKNHYPNGKITNQGKEFVYPTLSETSYINGVY